MIRILCPVDFSAHARSALRYALELARRRQGSVAVLFVSDPLLDAAAAAAAYSAKTLRDQSDAELRRFVAKAGAGPGDRLTVTTAFGQPAAEIDKAARRGGAELIVMGSRGLRGARKWFSGSTTERVLRGSRVPVLVVPRLKTRDVAAGAKVLSAWPGPRAIVAVDLDDYDAADVRAAAAAVHNLGATPVLAYAMLPARWPSWLPVNQARHLGTRLKSARDRLARLAGRLKIESRCQIVLGEPAEQLHVCAEDAGAALIVVTLRRGAGALGDRRGAITYQLVASEMTPILALPQARTSRRSALPAG